MSTEKRFLVFGAHPDDTDLVFGGTALKLTAAGHNVKFVSLCNGDNGHFSMPPEALAARRYGETQASAKISGLVEYQVLSNSDCVLQPSLENRREVVRIIREFKPDVVISHRLFDYHADHRATAQLVQDAAYLVTVPLFCPEVPIPETWPVFGFSWDPFQRPLPFQADAVVVIDDVLDQKLAMLNCHSSQFYEWLPWNKGFKDFDVTKMREDDIRQWLMENWICRNVKQAELFLTANEGRYAESFEMSEYGRKVTPEAFAAFFPA